jgi:hypothetical protein
MIRFSCSCGQQLQVDEKQVGASAACPVCARVVVVPDAETRLRHADPWYAPGDGLPVNQAGAAELTSTSTSGENDYQADRDRVRTKAFLSAVLVIAVPLVCAILLRLRNFNLNRPWSDGILALAGVAIASLVALAVRVVRRDVRPGGGRVIVVLAVSVLICLFAVVLLSPGTSSLAPQPAKTAFSDLTEIGFALREFQRQNGHFPAAAICSGGEKPLLSWRVAILPYLEGGESLYRDIHLDEPWDSRHNSTLLSRMPAQFADGEQPDMKGRTRVQAYVGPGTAFEGPRGHALGDFPDGPGKTLLVVEGQELVPWMKPVDISFGPEVVLVRPHKRGLEKPYYLVLAADCTVHSVPVGTPEETLRALITRNNREKVEWP